MRLDTQLTLKGRTAADGSLTWDSATGELGGTLADAVRALAESAARDGHVVTDPQPTQYDVTDPLHDPHDMALVLSQLWTVPDALTEFLPPVPEADETASVALIY